MQFKSAMEIKMTRLEMEDGRLKDLLELKYRQHASYSFIFLI